jgi:hemoglobin
MTEAVRETEGLAMALPVRPTEPEIHRMVHDFYGRVRRDEMLGPIFEARIGDRWEAHLARMVDFWTSILLASGSYLGNPLETHRTVPGVTPEHFDRWLVLFRQTVDDVLAKHQASDVFARAHRMRFVLERHAGHGR